LEIEQMPPLDRKRAAAEHLARHDSMCGRRNDDAEAAHVSTPMTNVMTGGEHGPWTASGESKIGNMSKPTTSTPLGGDFMPSTGVDKPNNIGNTMPGSTKSSAY
jgi:hypothetical protein